LLPLGVVALGVLLLLENFLLLGGFQASALLPLGLAVLGAWVLIRGDLGTRAARTFGITRGSVEAAVLEISAGEVDVVLGRAEREGRLIEGQFAHASRPALEVEGVDAYLRFDRAATPWTSFADWQIRLADDLPWQVLVSTSLGQVNADLSGLIVRGGLIATGLGDVRVVCPSEALAPLDLRSAAGDIHIVAPAGQAARVHVRQGRLFKVRFAETRWQQVAPDVYEAVRPDPDSPLVELNVRGTFGDAYLA
jgi:hypothetical protein